MLESQKRQIADCLNHCMGLPIGKALSVAHGLSEQKQSRILETWERAVSEVGEVVHAIIEEEHKE